MSDVQQPAPDVRLTRVDRHLATVVVVVPTIACVLGIVLVAFGVRPGICEVVLFCAMSLMTAVGVEIGYHRLFTHRSFRTSNGMQWLFAVWGSMAFQGPVIWWAAIHRCHHQHSDDKADPHTPYGHNCERRCISGILHAHLGWLFRPSSTRPPNWRHYVRDLYQNDTVLRVHVHYYRWLVLGLLVPTLLCGVVHMSMQGLALGLLWPGLIRICVMNHLAFWSVNSVTHAFGSQRYETGDHSRNNPWFALFTLGQSWHNNHHAFPNSAYMGHCWWQFDPGGAILRGLEVLGVVWDVQRPSNKSITNV